MKFIHFLALAAALSLASCADLAGTSLSVDSQGNVMITATRPIIIPAK